MTYIKYYRLYIIHNGIYYMDLIAYTPAGKFCQYT